MIEKRVCSLELSKELKELGVRQASAFHWVEMEPSKFELLHCNAPMKEIVSYSAFLASELSDIFMRSHTVRVIYYSYGRGYIWIGDEEFTIEFRNDDKEFQNDVDAYAKMLIHLIKTGVVNPGESPKGV